MVEKDKEFLELLETIQEHWEARTHSNAIVEENTMIDTYMVCSICSDFSKETWILKVHYMHWFRMSRNMAMDTRDT